jgi:hypothetical protein
MYGIRWIRAVATLLFLAACGGGEVDELRLKKYADNPGQTPLKAATTVTLPDARIRALEQHVDNPGQTPMKDVSQPGNQLDGGIRALQQHVDNPGQTPMKP